MAKKLQKVKKQLAYQRAKKEVDLQEACCLTEREVANLLGVGMRRLQVDRAKCKGIPYVKIGGSVRYRLADIVAYLERHTVKPVA